MNRLLKYGIGGRKLATGFASLLLSWLVSFPSLAEIPPPAFYQAPVEVSDATLAGMRGRFAQGNQVIYFGVRMVSSWQTPDGTEYSAGIDMGIDLSGKHHRNPKVTVNSSVHTSPPAHGLTTAPPGQAKSAKAHQNPAASHTTKGPAETAPVAVQATPVTNPTIVTAATIEQTETVAPAVVAEPVSVPVPVEQIAAVAPAVVAEPVSVPVPVEQIAAVAPAVVAEPVSVPLPVEQIAAAAPAVVAEPVRTPLPIVQPAVITQESVAGVDSAAVSTVVSTSNTVSVDALENASGIVQGIHVAGDNNVAQQDIIMTFGEGLNPGAGGALPREPEPEVQTAGLTTSSGVALAAGIVGNNLEIEIDIPGQGRVIQRIGGGILQSTQLTGNNNNVRSIIELVATIESLHRSAAVDVLSSLKLLNGLGQHGIY